MTSAARTNKPTRRGGFTLLEIVIVLALASMVLAGAVGMMIYSSDERALKSVSSDIESLAKRARVTAILQQTPYALEFREGNVRMLPFAQAGVEESRSARSRRSREQQPASSAGSDNRMITLDGDMRLSILRWNSNKWLAVGKDSVHVWRFDPDGLCEPISVRLAYGKSWLEDSFHPLTASIQDTQSEIR